jgi:hypothetical protein
VYGARSARAAQKGLDSVRRQSFCDALRVPQGHSARDSADTYEYKPRFIDEVPIGHATINISVITRLRATADVQEAVHVLLGRHIDGYDLTTGVSLNDVSGDPYIVGGEFVADTLKSVPQHQVGDIDTVLQQLDSVPGRLLPVGCRLNEPPRNYQCRCGCGSLKPK